MSIKANGKYISFNWNYEVGQLVAIIIGFLIMAGFLSFVLPHIISYITAP